MVDVAGDHSKSVHPVKNLHSKRTPASSAWGDEPVEDFTDKFTVKRPRIETKARETDKHRISQRQKQIDFGKNTLGYGRYFELVPRKKRKRGDPQTPDPYQVCSKRSWDGQVRKWRRLLHEYDPPSDREKDVDGDAADANKSTKSEEDDDDDDDDDVNDVGDRCSEPADPVMSDDDEQEKQERKDASDEDKDKDKDNEDDGQSLSGDAVACEDDEDPWERATKLYAYT